MAHAYVIQIQDARLATSTLTVAQKNGDDIKLRKRIAEMVRREAGRSKTLVICAKAARLALTGESAANLAPSIQWQGADITHFGRHLGVNIWADFDTVIVLGRLQMRPLEAERQARAIWGDADGITLELPGKYGVELRRHDLRNGSANAVKVQVHTDRRVQALVEIIRENAMGQGLDRLRLIHRGADRPGRVLVLCNLPVPGLVVDELVTKDDMLEGGTIWQRAMARMTAGVLPLAPDWLHSTMPDLFTSLRTTERECGKLIPPFANKNLYWQMAVLRKRGKTRHFRALIRADVPPEAARAEVERLLGCELAEFRMMDAPAAAPAVEPADVMPAEPEAVMPPVDPLPPEPAVAPAAQRLPMLPWQMDLFVDVEMTASDQVVWQGGIMPNLLRAAARFQLRRWGVRQDDFARSIGLSRPQVTNMLMGRFGASPVTAAAFRAQLHAMESAA